jgi:hypothetical protein
MSLCSLQVEEVLSYARIRPVANQIELHPLLAQRKLLGVCRRKVSARTFEGRQPWWRRRQQQCVGADCLWCLKVCSLAAAAAHYLPKLPPHC